MSVYLVIQHAMRMRHIIIYCLPRTTILFSHCLIKGTIFEKKKKLLNTKCLFRFSLRFLSEIFLILRRAERDVTVNVDGFGGLVVSMLASGTQFLGFKPGRSRWIFTGVKILSMPSSGGEVKESVPCPSFAACQRT